MTRIDKLSKTLLPLRQIPKIFGLDRDIGHICTDAYIPNGPGRLAIANIPPELRVPRQIHFSHAALADKAGNFVGSETSSGSE